MFIKPIRGLNTATGTKVNHLRSFLLSRIVYIMYYRYLYFVYTRIKYTQIQSHVLKAFTLTLI